MGLYNEMQSSYYLEAYFEMNGPVRNDGIDTQYLDKGLQRCVQTISLVFYLNIANKLFP